MWCRVRGDFRGVRQRFARDESKFQMMERIAEGEVFGFVFVRLKNARMNEFCSIFQKLVITKL